ncbi:MAG: hypothetical protein CL927_11795 [Deltaproteobacteria bacterium]|nr:hypothetical protein [Deltaproteobacteria bacterium]HCH62604.1 hypothetical protein [Deltaproteobacteria bacterium]
MSIRSWILVGCTGCGGTPGRLPVATDFITEVGTDAALDTANPEIMGDPAPYDPAPPGRLVRRAHLELLGTLPPVELVRAAETDLEGALAAVPDADGLEEGLVDFFDRAWSMRLDSQDFTPTEVDDANRVAWAQMVGEEPLRLAAHIVAEDQPWSTVVTADWTMATPELAALWPLEVDGSTGWHNARYTDGRPAGGVLFTNGFRWRFPSGPNNQQRSRANALSRMFLCFDYLDLPVAFDRSVLGESGDLTTATRTEPACLSCHATLDPIAAGLFGFLSFESYDLVEQSLYHPEREPMGPADMEVAYDWYGTPYAGAVELGSMVASDPRFAQCAVETVAATLWQRDIDTAVDALELAALQAVYDESGGRLLPVIRAAMQQPTWQAGQLQTGATPTVEVGRARMLTTHQLSRAIEEATGYRWTTNNADLLTTAESGYRAISGGGDPATFTPPADRPGVGHALVLDRVAWAAGVTAARGDLAGSGPGLLAGVSADTRPGTGTFDAVLEHLHLRLHGVAPTADERAAVAALWQSVFDLSNDPTTAWATVVAALLRDPHFWTA